MTILDRALRLGEGKQFKQYAKRVERINQWEPELARWACATSTSR
jgi:hypothetical protein